jgi:hypothetical protein
MQVEKNGNAKDELIAFNDGELGTWLIELVEDRSENFLCALAEAVVTAGAEDYGLIRSSLLRLKSKYAPRLST